MSNASLVTAIQFIVSSSWEDSWKRICLSRTSCGALASRRRI